MGNPRLLDDQSADLPVGAGALRAALGACLGARAPQPSPRRHARRNRLTGARPNPLLRATYYLDNSATSQYASWQTTLRKRYSHRLSGSVHYTWGKNLAYNGGDIGTWYQGDNAARVQDFFNIRAEHAPGTGDITHYFVSEWTYDLPALAASAAAHVRVLMSV